MESTTRSPIYSSFGETISGSSLIRAYNVQNRFIKENFEKVDFNLKFQYASLMCNRWLGMRLEAFANLIVFAVAIFGKSRINDINKVKIYVGYSWFILRLDFGGNERKNRNVIFNGKYLNDYFWSKTMISESKNS